MLKPIFSLIIPVHNEEDTLQACLESIFRNRGRFEVIVVNDGSTDRTIDIAKKFPVKLINFHKGHSYAFAFNRGSKIARGKYLITLAGDFIVKKDFIKRLTSFIPFDCLSYHVLSYETKTIFQKNWSLYRAYIDFLGEKRYAIHCIRKKLFEKVGRFNENIFYNEDFDLKERLLRLNPVYKISDIVVHHIDPKTLSDFLRQRKWQGKGIYTSGSSLKYFIPCIFPPAMIIHFLKFYRFNKKFKDTFFYMVFDLFGRYVSFQEFLRLKIKK